MVFSVGCVDCGCGICVYVPACVCTHASMHVRPPPPFFQQPETCKMARQLHGPVLPIKQLVERSRARPITDDEKKYSVFEALRQARADKRLVGVREKRARQKAEEAKSKKK